MSKICLYLDEDARDNALLESLVSRGVDVITVADTTMFRCSDEEQLIFAFENNRVIYTFNAQDFYRLHSLWLEEEKNHAGIIIAPQQRYSIGEQMRGILRLIAAKSAEQMQNNVEFISAWIL